jgi:hypothetical protein
MAVLPTLRSAIATTPPFARPTAEPGDTTPLTFRDSRESDTFIALLRNTIAWGAGA